MIIRHAERKRWTVIDREAVNDCRLSYRARGVLVWLLDKPDGWETRSEGIAKEGIEGREAIRTALRELEENGYLTREKKQTPGGQWVTETLIYEHPPKTGFRASAEPLFAEEPTPGKPTSEDRALSNQVLKASTRATNGASAVPDPRVQTLVAGYVEDYQSERNGKPPPSRWRAAAGKAAKEALAEGESVKDVAGCFYVIAHEGKNPSTLPYVLADSHAGRERRPVK